VVIRSFKTDVVGAVKSFLEPQKLQQMKRNVAAIENRAVFEIPELMASLLPGDEPNSREILSDVTAGR